MPPLSDDPSSRILDAAEAVFLERGYAGTRLRDLGAALGIQVPSLYHHAPGGKRELWDRVLTRAFDRHRDGLTAAAGAAGPDVRRQLVAMALWLLDQPRVNVAALAVADAGSSASAEAHQTSERLYEAIMKPVAEVYREAQARGDAVSTLHPDLFSGVFVSAVNGLAAADRAGSLPRPRHELAEEVVALLLDGARPRS